jgi:pimeloyl-ACP methyl ester carboxylesterase
MSAATITVEQVGPVRTRVWRGGDAGDAVLYLHGFEHHPGAAPFLQALAEHHRVVAPEHPGYGESTPVPQLDGVLDLVLHYRELVSALELGRVHVVGHCLGGMLAAELAAVCPEVVDRLVLVGALGLWLDDAPTADLFSFGERDLTAAKWHDPAAAIRPEPSIDAPDPDDPLASTIRRNQNLAVATKLLWPIPDRGLAKRLGLVAADTLVLHGRSDGLVPLAQAEALAEGIPGAELVVLEGAGHVPMLEQPEAFVAAVHGFLAGGS